MQDPARDFTPRGFEISVEAPARSAFLRLDGDTNMMSPADAVELSRRLASTGRALAALSRRLASTRIALGAAGDQVGYADEPRRGQPGERAS